MSKPKIYQVDGFQNYKIILRLYSLKSSYQIIDYSYGEYISCLGMEHQTTNFADDYSVVRFVKGALQ